MAAAEPLTLDAEDSPQPSGDDEARGAVEYYPHRGAPRHEREVAADAIGDKSKTALDGFDLLEKLSAGGWHVAICAGGDGKRIQVIGEKGAVKLEASGDSIGDAALLFDAKQALITNRVAWQSNMRAFSRAMTHRPRQGRAPRLVVRRTRRRARAPARSDDPEPSSSRVTVARRAA